MSSIFKRVVSFLFAFIVCASGMMVNGYYHKEQIDNQMSEMIESSKEELSDKAELKNEKLTEIEEDKTSEPDKLEDEILEAEIEKPEKIPETTESNLISLGEFKLTAYCPCSICCGKWAINRPNGIVYGAIGEPLKEGYSIAVDPEVIPYKSKVVIDGHTYESQDCGGAIKGNRIDVYMEDHQKALEFGVQYKEVFIKK